VKQRERGSHPRLYHSIIRRRLQRVCIVRCAHDAVQVEVLLDPRVGKECEGDGARISDTSRLEDDVGVGSLRALPTLAVELKEGADDVLAEGAADAAVGDGDDVLLGAKLVRDCMRLTLAQTSAMQV
jgi:hypothetical protein